MNDIKKYISNVMTATMSFSTWLFHKLKMAKPLVVVVGIPGN